MRTIIGLLFVAAVVICLVGAVVQRRLDLVVEAGLYTVLGVCCLDTVSQSTEEDSFHKTTK